MHPSRGWIVLVVFSMVWSTGCSVQPQPRGVEDATPDFQRKRPAIDRTQTGTIQGQVVWDGEAPEVPPFVYFHHGQNYRWSWHDAANPNGPQIAPQGHGLAQAVVYLEREGAWPSRNWDHPPVEIELRDYQIGIRQGKSPTRRVGIARLGSTIQMQSRDPRLRLLQARGAAFFTLAFPDPNHPLERRLDQRGLIELSDASSYFWARAYLFVDDHPYYAITDAEGAFQLREVPPGSYQLICWHPHWQVARQERDPENGFIARQWYRDPLRQSRPIHVQPGQTIHTEFRVKAELLAIRQ